MKNLLLSISLLLLHKTNLYAQSEPNSTQTINKLLELKWVHDVGEWSPYDGKPFVKNSILFPYHLEEFAIDIHTGEKLNIQEKKTQDFFRFLFKDSLLLRDNYDQASISNLYTGKVIFTMPRKGPAYYGYVSPELITSDVIFVAKDSNTISAINLVDNSTIWKFLSAEKILVNVSFMGSPQKVFLQTMLMIRETWL